MAAKKYDPMFPIELVEGGDTVFQAVRLNKYLDFQRNGLIHRKDATNAKVLLIFRKSAY